jgi:hypothetical protein
MKIKSATLLILAGLLSLAAKSALPKAGDFVELGDDSSPPLVQPAPVNENEKTFSGTVRVLRKIDHTEVFFKDLPDSYVIPSGNSYSSIYKAFMNSQKTGASVTFKANIKSRRVLSIEDPGTSAAAGGIK